MNSCQKYFSTGLLALLTLAAFAQSAPALGAVSEFAVLAGPTVTCIASTITGDVGVVAPVSPGGSVTQANCRYNGTIHSGDANASQGNTTFLTAYNALAQTRCDQVLTGTLAGVTLSPGVYCFDAAATLTGLLRLKGPSNGIWLFKVGTSGTGALTGNNFFAVMEGGGQACNVTWWVAEAATMTTSDFLGTILAGAAITITGGTFNGDALAKASATLTGTVLAGCEGGGGTRQRDPGNSNQGSPFRKK